MARKPVPDSLVEQIGQGRVLEFGYWHPRWTTGETERYVRWDMKRRGYKILHHDRVSHPYVPWAKGEAFYALGEKAEQ